MQFISLVGMSFVVVAAVLCRLTPVRLKPVLLLGASYLFYCTWDPGMVLALLIATAICYFAALRIEQLRSSRAGSALDYRQRIGFVHLVLQAAQCKKTVCSRNRSPRRVLSEKSSTLVRWPTWPSPVPSSVSGNAPNRLRFR
jgi:hypothetical protein